MTDSYAFTAFGVPVATSGTTVNPHRYIGALGYYTDPATGLDYIRARYLRPTTGSWLSVDPVPSEPRYQYVGGRATRAVDASGRLAGLVAIGAAALGYALAVALCVGEARDYVAELPQGPGADPPPWAPGWWPDYYGDAGGPDKWKHCMANCLIRVHCGRAASLVAIPGSELGGHWDPYDVVANLGGFAVGSVIAMPGGGVSLASLGVRCAGRRAPWPAMWSVGGAPHDRQVPACPSSHRSGGSARMLPGGNRLAHVVVHIGTVVGQSQPPRSARGRLRSRRR